VGHTRLMINSETFLQCGRAETPLVLSAEDRASSAGVGAKGGCYVSRRERCG
jgi:hypothetical protein